MGKFEVRPYPTPPPDSFEHEDEETKKSERRSRLAARAQLAAGLFARVSLAVLALLCAVMIYFQIKKYVDGQVRRKNYTSLNIKYSILFRRKCLM